MQASAFQAGSMGALVAEAADQFGLKQLSWKDCRPQASYRLHGIRLCMRPGRHLVWCPAVVVVPPVGHGVQLVHAEGACHAWALQGVQGFLPWAAAQRAQVSPHSVTVMHSCNGKRRALPCAACAWPV